jgi:hypothetical protein
LVRSSCDLGSFQQRIVVGGEDIDPRQLQEQVVQSAGLMIGIGILCANQKIKFPPVKRRFVLAGNPKRIPTIELRFSRFCLLRRLIEVRRVQLIEHGAN